MKKMIRYSLFIALLFLIGSCKSEAPKDVVFNEEQLEAREDSLELIAAYARQAKIKTFIHPDVETKAMLSPDIYDDAADDMAVWVNASNPEKSLIIGTNKKGGIAVYNLQGEEIAFYPTGRINNIDVMYACPLGNTTVDLVGCTNRSDQSIDLFRIDPVTGALVDITAHALQVDTNIVKDVYGFCFYRGDKPFLFVNGKNGVVQQFEIISTTQQKIDLKLARQVAFDSQTEGMVADEEFRVLYIGEEDKGIWKMPADPGAGEARTLVPSSGEDNPQISYDIEGLAIYKENGKGYLLASSQGNFSYAVFERAGNNRYLCSFKVTDSSDIDGIEETDGIETVNKPLGKNFPKGIFVAQDGFNYNNGKLDRQNFKIVNWEKIEKLILEK